MAVDIDAEIVISKPSHRGRASAVGDGEAERLAGPKAAEGFTGIGYVLKLLS